MDFVNVQWQGQPPVSVTTPYNPGATWAPTSWVRDAEAQTLSMHEVVREFLMNMVMDGLRSKGLPLMACPHTRGLQLENVISGIVDNHSIMCSHTPQHQDSYANWAEDIPLQDVNDDDLETQRASHIVAQLTAFAKSAYDPSMSTGGKTRKPVQQSGNVLFEKQSVAIKRPANPVHKDSGEPSKRRKSAPGTIYKCSKCEKVFHLSKDLIRHEARHSLDRPFKCDKCDYRAKTQHQRSKHYRMIHQNKYPHYCGICGRGCHSLQSKIEHEHCHLKSEDKPFKCTYCNKGHPSQRRLDLHVRLHEEDKKIKCEMCEVKFVTSNGYKSHLKLVHKAFCSVNSNKCLVCNVEMVERHLLMEHMKEKHRDVGDSCDACGMKFSNNQKLEAHLNRHHRKLPPMDKPSEVSFKIGGDEKSFVMCELCGGLFADASTLSQHNAIHKDKGLTDDVILRITSAQRQIAGYRGRDRIDGSQTHASTTKPKARLGRPPNPSVPQGTLVQASKPGKKVDQGGEPVVVQPEKVSKPCSRSTETTMLEKDSGKTAVSGMHAVQTAKSQDSQSKITDNPVGNTPSKEAFIIYTKSPDKVADMLLKGQLKLTLKVPVSGSAKSQSRDENISQTRNPPNQVPVPCVKDTPNPPVSLGLSNASTTATKLSQSGVPPTAPMKLVVTRDGSGLQSSPMPSPTSHPQRVQTLESSMVEQTKETGQPERSHLQPQIGITVKDGKPMTECEQASKDGTDSSSPKEEDLIICTSSPDKMMDMLKRGEMKVVISQKQMPLK